MIATSFGSTAPHQLCTKHLNAPCQVTNGPTNGPANDTIAMSSSPGIVLLLLLLLLFSTCVFRSLLWSSARARRARARAPVAVVAGTRHTAVSCQCGPAHPQLTHVLPACASFGPSSPAPYPSNSWDTVSIEYTSLSKEMDEFVYTHQVSRPACCLSGGWGSPRFWSNPTNGQAWRCGHTDRNRESE